MKYFFLSIIILALSIKSYGQNSATNSGGQVNQIQPSIIVIPYKKDGEKYKSLLQDPEKGFQKRLAISRMKEAFDSRGLLPMISKGS